VAPDNPSRPKSESRHPAPRSGPFRPDRDQAGPGPISANGDCRSEGPAGRGTGRKPV